MTTTTRRLFATLAGSLATASMLSVASAQSKPSAGRSKVVFQMSEADPMKWGLALNNMRNVQIEVGEDDVDVELVAFGPGIAMLKGDSSVAKRVAEALKAGVKVVACENTMKGQKLAYGDMLPDIGYVPSGVVELMRKQQQGYAYVRP
jgi:intracellular sulfur oxidation DsrE/DsrF family protein